MFSRALKWALAICVGAVVAVEAVGQTPPDQTSPEKSSPQTPPDAPDMTGWYRVSDLFNGQRIAVSLDAGFPIHCIFRGTTDHSLLCDQGSRLFGIRHREFARDEVKRVRTDDAAHKSDIVVLTLTGTGAVLGGVSPLTTNVASGLKAAGIGGLIGAAIGGLASMPMALFNDDKTLYTHPGHPSAAHLRWPLRKRKSGQIELAQVQ